MKSPTQRFPLLKESLISNLSSKIFDQQFINSLIFIEQNPNKQFSLYETSNNNKIQRYTISVNASDYFETMKIYQWRKSTDLPIVKTYCAQVINKCQDDYTMHIYNESYQSKLSLLSNIPLSQLIYILKESIIGFQRLFYRFGPFKIDPDMICINKNGQCKVWIHQHYECNKFYPLNISECQFAKNLTKIFVEKVQKKKVSIAFFEELEKVENLIDMLDFIEEYIKVKKIKIPSIFEQFSYSELRKTSKRQLNKNLMSYTNLLKHHKSLQKISVGGPTQNNCQEKFEKLSFKSIFEFNRKNKNSKFVNPSIIFKKSNENIQNETTLRTSSNTTNSYTFKSKLNLSCQFDQILDKKAKELKPRKQSQKIKTNTYEIFDIDNEQVGQQSTAEKKKPYQSYIVNMNSIKQNVIQAGIMEDNTELVSDQQSDQQELNTLQIFKKNGWSNNVQEMFNTTPLKQSFRIGQDQNLQNNQYQFKILKPPGMVYKSILPEDFE